MTEFTCIPGEWYVTNTDLAKKTAEWSPLGVPTIGIDSQEHFAGPFDSLQEAKKWTIENRPPYDAFIWRCPDVPPLS